MTVEDGTPQPSQRALYLATSAEYGSMPMLTGTDCDEQSNLVNDKTATNDTQNAALLGDRFKTDKDCEDDTHITEEIFLDKDHVIKTQESVIIDNSKTVHKAAPDGGYGWVVLFAGTLSFYCVGAIWTAFSVLYTEYIHHFNSSTAVIGFIIAAEAVAVHLTGAFLGWPIQRFGTDKVTVIGGFISTAGCLIASQCVSVPMMYVAYAIAGIGCGCCIMSIIVSVNQYFETKRVLANGICLAGVSLSTLTQPLLSRWLIDKYSWRGALIITAGIYLQLLWLGLLLKPLNPYIKKPKRQTAKAKNFSESEHDMSKHTSRGAKCCSVILKIFDVRLFLNVRFVLIGCGNIAFSLGFQGFFLHLSNRAIVEGMEVYKAAALVSVLGICNLVFRIIMGLLVTWLKTNNMLTMTGGLIASGATCIVSLFATTFVHYSIITCIFAFVNAAVIVVQTPVLVDILGIGTLPKSNGVMQLFNVVGAMVATPFAGFIYDRTGSYGLSYSVIGSMEIFGGLLVLLCFIITFRRSRKEKRTNSS